LIIAFEIILIDENPSERSGIAAHAVEVGTDHFADATSGAPRHVCENDRSGQGNLLTVGKRKYLDQVPKGNDTAQAQGTDGQAF
jgi:hypothetical protein